MTIIELLKAVPGYNIRLVVRFLHEDGTAEWSDEYSYEGKIVDFIAQKRKYKWLFNIPLDAWQVRRVSVNKRVQICEIDIDME